MKKHNKSVKPQTDDSTTNVDYKDACLRAQADYQNLVKEMDVKRAEWVEFANQGLLMDLLPVIEHFNQGLKYIPSEHQDADWIVGIKQVKKQLDDFMAEHGLVTIETVGQPFDPDLHEAVSRRDEPDVESDTVVEEVMGGYKLSGKVIQAAKVIVAE